MSSHEEYSLAMLTIEQENDKKKRLRFRALRSDKWCWITQSCVLHAGHDGVCLRDLGW